MTVINVELQDVLEETPYGLRGDVLAWAINEYDSLKAIETLANEGVVEANVEHVLGQKMLIDYSQCTVKKYIIIVIMS